MASSSKSGTKVLLTLPEDILRVVDERAAGARGRSRVVAEALRAQLLPTAEGGSRVLPRGGVIVASGGGRPMSASLRGYQLLAARTANAVGPSDPKFERKLAVFALGLAGEAGEVVELVKKNLGHGHSLDIDRVTKELGDVLWYIAAMATLLEVNLEEVAAKNIEKLRARYPNGFDPVRSQQRAVDDQ